jgi:hypothetical protein
MLFLGLGTMFAGMAIQRAAQNFLQPAAEAAGVFDILGAIFTLLFLPVVLALIPALVWVLDKISKLDEDTKMWIGSVVLFAFVLGGALAVFGQAMTFISSLSEAKEAVDGLEAFVKLMTSADTATKVGDIFTKIKDFFNTPLGALVLTVAAIETGKLIYHALEKEAPPLMKDIVEATSGIPLVGDIFAGAAGLTLGGMKLMDMFAKPFYEWLLGSTPFGLPLAGTGAGLDVLGQTEVSSEERLAQILKMLSFGVINNVNINVNAKGITANSEIENMTSKGGIT